jgi:hypothetical protein
MRIQPGPVTSLDVRVSAPDLKPEHFSQRGETGRLLAAIGRERVLRAWLNGRRVTAANGARHPLPNRFQGVDRRWVGAAVTDEARC